MEETGIIRRLDALGRIVIPREFRKLNRIEVGDPVEMRALSDGEILLRKVDMSAQLRSLGQMALPLLADKVDKLIGVCSQEEWLQFSARCEFEGEELPAPLAKAVTERKSSVVACDGQDKRALTKYVAIYPIFGDTGVFGAYALFTDTEPTATEKALFETMAGFTGKSLQKF